MEQGVTAFLKAAEALGPVVIVLGGIFGLILWQLLRLYNGAVAENRRISDARVADVLSNTQVVRDNTAAITAQNVTSQAQADAIERLDAKLDKFIAELMRTKRG